jgi:hypothetical protein
MLIMKNLETGAIIYPGVEKNNRMWDIIDREGLNIAF